MKLKILLVALITLVVSSCATGPKPDSDHKEEIYSRNWEDKFTGSKSCYTVRESTYTNGLMSYNVGIDIKCGTRITLIKSDALTAQGKDYIGVKKNRAGGICAGVYGYPKEDLNIASYWVYGDTRSRSSSLGLRYYANNNFSQLQPKPQAVQTLEFFKQFINSDEIAMLVRIGESGGEIIPVDKELASQFLSDCF